MPKTTNWRDEPYAVRSKKDEERILALSGRILVKMITAGAIWRDIDFDSATRKLAKKELAVLDADLKRAFKDRHLPDWMVGPARESYNEALSQYEQGCILDDKRDRARVIFACAQLDADCAGIDGSYTNRDVAEILARFLAITAEAMPIIVPDTYLASILLGPPQSAEELAR